MLLTINYRGKDTQELGYLLHKNPSRPQEFALSYGKAYVFYPEVSDESTTAALLLDIDPIDLARGRQGGPGGLFDYVNDRPYVSSSFMSTAISRVFGTAMAGRSKDRQALADTPLQLTAKIHMLSAPNRNMIPEIFEPLGYTVEMEGYANDDRFLQWGMSRYITLTLSGRVLLRDLLNHLYVLIPVFDTQKHYYISKEEINKLLSHGGEWLKTHPRREYIAARYLGRRKSLVDKALEILLEESPAEEEAAIDEPQEKKEKKQNLNQIRLGAVLEEAKACRAGSVIDMGCGEGNLLRLLLKEKQFTRVAATDVSFSVLERARDRLKTDRMPETLQNKLTIFQSSLIYRDKRFEGFDCACVVEVIEHMDPDRLRALEKVLFEFSQPRTVIITTPNSEYNINYTYMPDQALRHGDHRFEWNRRQFSEWAETICRTYPYTMRIREIGERDEVHGAPTQMGVFTLCE